MTLRSLPSLALVLLVALPVVSGSHTVAPGNALYVDATGAWDAHVRIHGPCNGPVVVKVFVVRGLFGDHYEVPGRSTMVPDPCLVACLDCPVPFVWTLETDGFLAGGGVAGPTGGGFLQGTFLGGAMQLRWTPFL